MQDFIKATFDKSVESLCNTYPVKAVFLYGSAVYQNKTPSDLDLIVVLDDSFEINNNREDLSIDNFEIQLSLVNESNFVDELKNSHIRALESFFLKDYNASFVYNTTDFDYFFTLFDASNFNRSQISRTSSNSYVKAKKKVIIEKDFDKNCSLKSLWHSFRVLDFAFQIATSGKIHDFSSLTSFYNMIVMDYDTFDIYSTPNDFWDSIHSKYAPLKNRMMSDIRERTEKK